MSVEETNKLRAKLGMKLLDAPDTKDDPDKPKKKEDVHKPATNISATKKAEVLREKLAAAKEKRRVNKLLGYDLLKLELFHISSTFGGCNINLMIDDMLF